MLYRMLSVFLLQRPKTVILFWAVFLIVFGSFAPKLPSALSDHGLMPQGSYREVQHILSGHFRLPLDPVIMVFEKKPAVTDVQFRLFIAQTVERVRETDGLKQIVSPLEHKGMIREHAAYALLDFDRPQHEMEPVFEQIRNRMPSHPEIQVKLTGKSAVQLEVNRASAADLRKAEMLGVPAALLILLIAFGGFVSSMIPVLAGLISVAGTMGMMVLLAERIELSNFVLNVIPMAGMALSIDFALMLVSRFREELAFREPHQALVITLQTAGRAVLFSAGCVLFGLIGILVIPLPMFQTVALGAIAVLAVSAFIALTLVPVLLSILHPSILAESKRSAAGKGTAWHAWARYAMKRPVRLFLFASGLLTVCILPLSRMEIAIPDASSLPPHYESRAAYETYRTLFTTPDVSHVYVVAQSGVHPLREQDWRNVYRLAERLERDPGVLWVDSVFSRLALPPDQLVSLLQNQAARKQAEPLLRHYVHRDRVLIRAAIKGGPASQEAHDWLRRWEREGNSAELPFLLGGEAKYEQEVMDAIQSKIKPVLLFIAVTNFSLLLIMFRSILIPVKTIVLNLMSLGAAFGLLAWLFNGGHFTGEAEAIAIMIPVFIFGLVFGISMDYGVFLVSRISEEYRKTKDNDAAVVAGLASTGRVISMAAAIMIAVTAPFAFGDVAGVRQLGFGIAAAIFIDATVIRMMLVPSFMKLMGRWNWWAPGKFR
jgi:RND superfamily putative drug exporter